MLYAIYVGRKEAHHYPRQARLDFADAHRVFAGAIALFGDSRDDYGEQRMIAVGLLDTLVVLIVHIETDNTIRVISMRKADKNETNIYTQEIGAI